MRTILTSAIAGCALLLVGCAPTTLYNWGGGSYQNATYSYVKNNTEKDAEALLATYRYMVDHPTGTRKVVPPGIYADYGLLLYKQGKKDEAIRYMKMEIELYPEATVFIGRIIKQIEQQ
jgi:hypothetical protein